MILFTISVNLLCQYYHYHFFNYTYPTTDYNHSNAEEITSII